MNLNNKKHFSNRDKILTRIFKIYVNKGLYKEDEYHNFCKFAKGKSESYLYSKVSD